MWQEETSEHVCFKEWKTCTVTLPHSDVAVLFLGFRWSIRNSFQTTHLNVSFGNHGHCRKTQGYSLFYISMTTCCPMFVGLWRAQPNHWLAVLELKNKLESLWIKEPCRHMLFLLLFRALFSAGFSPLSCTLFSLFTLFILTRWLTLAALSFFVGGRLKKDGQDTQQYSISMNYLHTKREYTDK